MLHTLAAYTTMHLGAFICTHICCTYTQDYVMVLCNPLKKVQYELDALCSSIYTKVHIYPHCANIYILTVRVAYLWHVQTMLLLALSKHYWMSATTPTSSISTIRYVAVSVQLPRIIFTCAVRIAHTCKMYRGNV